MAFSDYTESTEIIANLGTDPEDRPDMDDDEFKGKFDENAAKIKTWLNGTHKTELTALETKTDAKENKEITYVAVTASRDLTADDLYKWIVATHAATPIVLTMPKDLTTEDAWIVIEQGGAAQVSVSAATDVTIKPATKLKVNGQDSAAVLTHRSGTPNTWGFQGSVKA